MFVPLVIATVTVWLSSSVGAVYVATTRPATVAAASSTTVTPELSVNAGASLTDVTVTPTVYMLTPPCPSSTW